MAVADISSTMNAADGGETAAAPARPMVADPHSEAAAQVAREKFLPVTRHALLDRLTAANLWPNGDACRRAASCAISTTGAGIPTRSSCSTSSRSTSRSARTPTCCKRAPSARRSGLPCSKRLVAQMSELLEQGNFTRVDPASFHVILTKDSHYGLDLQVDIHAFEEILIFYRGATTITERHRDIRKAYMGWKEVKVPVFQRLFILFKLKPFE